MDTDFEALSSADKRVAIAQDAKAQILASKVVPNRGTFVAGLAILRDAVGHDLQSVLLQDSAHCSACAIGSLFVSTVRKANKFMITEDVQYWGGIGSNTRQKASPMFERLREYFEFKQIQLIECAFELGAGWFGVRGKGWSEDCLSIEKRRPAAQFGSAHSDPVARMLAILENIIVNNGEFIPCAEVKSPA